MKAEALRLWREKERQEEERRRKKEAGEEVEDSDGSPASGCVVLVMISLVLCFFFSSRNLRTCIDGGVRCGTRHTTLESTFYLLLCSKKSTFFFYQVYTTFSDGEECSGQRWVSCSSFDREFEHDLSRIWWCAT